MRISPRIRTQLKGVVGLVVIAVIVTGLYGTYQQWFRSVTTVTVEADRAGLLLDRGASVRLYGVAVGQVRNVEATSDGARIEIAIDDDQAHLIPSSATASITATTLFGAKLVELSVPEGPVDDPIRAGQTLQASSTTIEANDVFQDAMTLLDGIDVEQLNTTLTATAEAFEGRGEKLGELITGTDTLLTGLNPSLDQLGEDFALTDTFLTNINAVFPQLLDVADQVSTTAETFTETQTEFREATGVFIPTVDAVTTLARSFDAPLTAATTFLEPTSELLRQYSPALTCTLDQLSEHNTRFAAVFDQKYPALMGHTSFLPGQDPYTFAENAPKLVGDVGPRCYRQISEERPLVPHIQLDDGTYDVYTPDYRVTGIGTPITFYEDAIRSFLGNAGLNALLGGPQGGTP